MVCLGLYGDHICFYIYRQPNKLHNRDQAQYFRNVLYHHNKEEELNLSPNLYRSSNPPKIGISSQRWKLNDMFFPLLVDFFNINL